MLSEEELIDDVVHLFTSETMPPASHLYTPDSVEVNWRRLTFSINQSLSSLFISEGSDIGKCIQPCPSFAQTEPGAHIDDVGAYIDAVIESEGATVLALSYKDISLGDYLSERGAIVKNLFDDAEDDSIAGHSDFPLVVKRIDCDWPANLKAFDCVLARHLMEHVDDLESFLSKARKVLRPDGFLFLEVPDVGGQLIRKDPTLLWDEHRHYFTRLSLLSILHRLGWHVVKEQQLVSDDEEIIWVLASPRRTTRPVEPTELQGSSKERQLIIDYFRFIVEAKGKIRQLINRSNSKQALILGANHASAMFLNLVWPEEIPVQVVDDHQGKHGKQLSRLRVPVVSLENVEMTQDSLFFCGINRSRATPLIQRVKEKFGQNRNVQMLSDLAQILG